jgi:hypothetical protein
MEIEIRNSASQRAAINTAFEGDLKDLFSDSLLFILYVQILQNGRKRSKEA